ANLEAVVASGKIVAKNAEVLGKETAEFGRKSFADATATFKAYGAIKTPADFMQMYTDNAKKSFDALVAQGSKTTEMVVKMANDSFQPISNRIADVTTKLKTAA
ncbi:MAG: hypothetical protein RLZZ58_2064, partial [Pseudomonadota bacterium]